jgi:hypothetical protein
MALTVVSAMPQDASLTIDALNRAIRALGGPFQFEQRLLPVQPIPPSPAVPVWMRCESDEIRVVVDMSDTVYIYHGTNSNSSLNPLILNRSDLIMGETVLRVAFNDWHRGFHTHQEAFHQHREVDVEAKVYVRRARKGDLL